MAIDPKKLKELYPDVKSVRDTVKPKKKPKPDHLTRRVKAGKIGWRFAMVCFCLAAFAVIYKIIVTVITQFVDIYGGAFADSYASAVIKDWSLIIALILTVIGFAVLYWTKIWVDDWTKPETRKSKTVHQEIKHHLHKEPFDKIKSGAKTIEYRLNDEKRRELQIGDHITFYKRPLEDETIEVEVIDLKYYPNLLTMYTATFDVDFKDEYATPKDVVDATPYYEEKEINKYGCVAIYFKLIDE